METWNAALSALQLKWRRRLKKYMARNNGILQRAALPGSPQRYSATLEHGIGKMWAAEPIPRTQALTRKGEAPSRAGVLVLAYSDGGPETSVPGITAVEVRNDPGVASPATVDVRIVGVVVGVASPTMKISSTGADPWGRSSGCQNCSAIVGLLGDCCRISTTRTSARSCVAGLSCLSTGTVKDPARDGGKRTLGDCCRCE